jgi:folate-dependent phosphoribosylglycinamide formyltransferase PurN
VGGDDVSRAGGVVLLAGPGDATNIVYHHLERHVGPVVLVQEAPVSRVILARRRARRLGWVEVAGQLAFVGAALPALRRQAGDRIAAICAEAELDRSPVLGAHHVPSVNDPVTAALVADVAPAVVVVNGTRIISAAALGSMTCPVVNMHAGITPRYRGVHGGYWALAEDRPEEVGTTVHLVDPGIDTGDVLAQVTFAVTSADSIATYPYLHLRAGLPALVEQVGRARAGETLRPRPADPGAESHLRYHPTLWSYLRGRRRGVR